MPSLNLRPGALPSASTSALVPPRDDARHDAMPAWTQAFGRARAQAPAPSATAKENAKDSAKDSAKAKPEGRSPSAQDAPRDEAPREHEAWSSPAPLAAWQPPRDGLPCADTAPALNAAAGAEPVSPTAARMAEAARQVAEPAPLTPDTTRLWQVALPGVQPGAPGWQLQITQAQNLAPLVLDLRVPPAQALQARQQLADLDRRLRDAGHDLLRTRLRRVAHDDDAPRVDEVDS